MWKIRSLIFVAILFGLGLAQTQRGLVPVDLSVLKDLGDAQISPDGSRVVYVVSESTPDRTKMNSRLWIVPAAGGEPKRLTSGDAHESTPRWSPDGSRIAFYSNRDGRNGLWVITAAGGEPKLIKHIYQTNFYLKSAGESFTWSPDGKRIAFLSSVDVLADAPQAAASNNPQLQGLPPQALRPLTRDEMDKLPVEVREMIFRAQGQALGQRATTPIENSLSVIPDDPRVITRLQYKTRTSFSDNIRPRIFAVDLDTGALRQLTAGLFYEHSINWSPKGDEIVFVSNHEPDPDKLNNTDLFIVNVNTLAVRQLTKTGGCEWMPVFSPDGSEIAYLATKRLRTTIDSVAEDTKAYTIPTQGGETREVNAGMDRRVSTVKWRAQNSLYFVVGDRGRTLVCVEFERGKFQTLFRDNSQVTSISFAPGGSYAYTRTTFTRPAELFALTANIVGDRLRVSDAKKIVSVNDNLMNMLKVSEPIDFSFKNDEFDVQGWVVPPVNLVAGKKYPVILSIHGGPHGMYGHGFNPTVQAMAAHGYAVLLINPRGSSGYGQKFSDGCVNDWGGGDYRDLMKGVDEALGRFQYLDRDRMGVTGGSYGGYMTNWVVTQTDRFKAAVAVASLSNLISFYSTSLYQDLIHAEFSGYPWENYEILWDRSPLKHIKKAKTPLLLLHGEEDNDVHITQAEEMYTAMRMRGIDCVFVRYPREGHGFREPRHREDALARTLQWFDHYLKK